jgi:anti-sigma-K factor RskA
MMSQTNSHNEIRQYLLGSLSEEARERVEVRLLTEEEVYPELLAWEDELIDQYVNQGLSGEERKQFEAHFLCDPERQRKIRFARTLQKYIDARPKISEDTPPGFVEKLRAFWSSQSSGLSTAAALCIVAVIGGTIWFSFFRTSSPKTFAPLTLNLSTSNRAEGFDAAQVNLPLNADALKITLLLPPGSTAESYRVELVTASGQRSKVEIAGHDAQSVTIIILAHELTRGTYALKIFTINHGAEQPIPGSYFFKAT